MSVEILGRTREKIHLSPVEWRWIAIAALAMVDGILLAKTGIRISVPFLVSYSRALAFWGLLTFVYTYVRDNPRLAAMTQIVMQASLFSLVASIFSYLVLSFQAPLRDQEFAAFDAMLGFDWMAWFRWVDNHPWIGRLFIYAYWSIVAEMCFAIVLLPWIGRQRYLSELFTASVVASTTIILISGFVPAVGAWAHFGIGVPDWLPDILAMHSGAMPVLGEHDLNGIVVFPSFHTALALLFVWGVRWSRFLVTLSAGLNSVVILSVPSVGSHYFVDVIAGALIALFAIGVARRIENSGRAAPG